MKLRSILLVTALAVGFQSNAQWVADSVTMGAGYANDAYYKFGNAGAVTSPANNDWHLAFQMLPPGPYGSVSIWANHVQGGVSVYNLNLQASTKFATLTAADTVGKLGKVLYNPDTSWDVGALNTIKGTNVYDYGWGQYQASPNHDIQGDSIFLLKVGSAYYKLWVKQFISQPTDSVKYIFRIANFDGTGDTTIQIYRKNGFTDRIFSYYNVTTKVVSDREPSRSAWDMVFTRYMTQIPIGPGQFFANASTGVFSNYTTSVARAQHVMPDAAVMSNFTFSKKLNAIGYDWKVYDQPNNIYTMADSNSYFIKSKISEKYYQLQFLRFDGGSPAANGKIVFQTKDLGPTSVPTIAANAVNAYFVSPNPANNAASVMIDAKAASANTRIILTDLTGKTVQAYTVNLNNGINAFSFNTSSLPAGMYIVNTTNGDWKMTEKLMVQH